jgi:dephospho-CoA kinase
MSPYPMSPNLQHSPNIIGLAGKKRTGKNTTANHIAFELEGMDKKCTFRSFAEPIRQIGYSLGWDSNQMLEDKDAIHPIWKMTWRQFAQGIGSALRHGFRSDILLRMMDIELLDLDKQYDYVIIDDIRMQDEVEYVKAKGGMVIQMRRNTGVTDTHETEQGITNYDYVIDNNSTLDVLHHRCKAVAKDILEWSKNNVTQTITGRPNDAR